MDNLAEGKQEVMVNGKPRHVLGYLQDFLFHPKRAMTPVRALSGGERNRLLLARLFLKPSNLLILDEPTNDLDVETLELLEELIDSYQGTVLLVSHDRQFVDNTVTECWIFEGGGKIGRYVGGYHDARGQQEQYVALKQPAVKKTEEAAAAKAETVKRSSSNQAINCSANWSSYRNCSKIWRRSWKPYERKWRMLPSSVSRMSRRKKCLLIWLLQSRSWSKPLNAGSILKR